MDRWKVQQEDSGQSLQNFLKKQLQNLSGKQVKWLINSGKCLLNGRSEHFSSRLVSLGDTIELYSSQIDKQPRQSEMVVNESILYHDDDLIAYNKPSGIASDSQDLLNALQSQFGKAILLHRLDKETTGVLLFARNEQAAKTMEELFKKRLVKKTYYAIIDGIPKKTSGIIENHLGKLHVYQGQTIWGQVQPEKGLYAKTLWEVKKSGKGSSLVMCRPETGRTHQIRVHLSGLGHPILGDHQYRRLWTCSYHPQRMLLHAANLAFEHPTTKKAVFLTSPLPEDFIEAMRYLYEEAKANG